ncbi:hypothetical protein ACFX2G_022109 [Malus domestica]
MIHSQHVPSHAAKFQAYHVDNTNRKRKKKQSIQAKAKDSTTVINVHSTSSSIEKPNPPKLCKFKLHPEVKYDRLNISVHDRRNIPTDGIENSKSRQLKAAEYHLAAHMMD